MDNRTSPVYTNLSTIGVLANGTNKDIVTTNSGNLLLPKNPETLVYDADGNLKTNGLWVLTWDAENRLIGLDSASSVPVLAKQSLRFIYDFQGRRISKTVSNWTGSAWVFGYLTKFVYDGWNLLAEVNATNNAVLHSYIWGIDASGTLGGAGGLGGLLAVREVSTSTQTNYFYSSDANFSVRGTVSARDGAKAAELEYGPFGESIRASSEASQVMLRWSGRFFDVESGWTYYGYRTFANGRWLSRDPLEEWGNIPIYAYVGNDCQNAFDPLGLQSVIGGSALRPSHSLSPVFIGARFGTPSGFQSPQAFPPLPPIPSLSDVQIYPVPFNPTLYQPDEPSTLSIVLLGLPSLWAGRAGCAVCIRPGARVLAGPFGRVSAEVLANASKAGGPTVRIVTNLSRAPQAGRALSVALGDTGEVLASKATAASSGRIYVGEVPQALLKELECAGLAFRTTTLMNGVVGTEIKFLPAATEYIIPFLR